MWKSIINKKVNSLHNNLNNTYQKLYDANKMIIRLEGQLNEEEQDLNKTNELNNILNNINSNYLKEKTS